MAPIKKSTIFIGVAVLAGLIAAVKFFVPGRADQETGVKSTTTETASSGMGSGTMKREAKEVSVTTSYSNPGGKDDVSFSLSVDTDGMIVDAKSLVLAQNEISKKRQTAFAEGFPMAVKGKKLSELTAIDKVGGSSLTTKAFNDSLDELKAGF